MEVTIFQLGFILFPGLGNLAVPSSGNHFVIFPFKAKKWGLSEKQTRKVEKGIGAIIDKKGNHRPRSLLASTVMWQDHFPHYNALMVQLTLTEGVSK